MAQNSLATLFAILQIIHADVIWQHDMQSLFGWNTNGHAEAVDSLRFPQCEATCIQLEAFYNSTLQYTGDIWSHAIDTTGYHNIKVQYTLTQVSPESEDHCNVYYSIDNGANPLHLAQYNDDTPHNEVKPLAHADNIPQLIIGFVQYNSNPISDEYDSCLIDHVSILGTPIPQPTTLMNTGDMEIHCGFYGDCSIICNETQSQGCENGKFYVYNNAISIECSGIESCRWVRIVSENVTSLDISVTGWQAYAWGELQTSANDQNINIFCDAGESCTFNAFVINAQENERVNVLCRGIRACNRMALYSKVRLNYTCAFDGVTYYDSACDNMNLVLPFNTDYILDSSISIETVLKLQFNIFTIHKTKAILPNITCISECENSDGLPNVWIIYGIKFNEYCQFIDTDCMLQIELDSGNDDSFVIIDMIYDTIPPNFYFGTSAYTGSVLMIGNENINGHDFTPPMLLNTESWLSIVCIECSNVLWDFRSISNVVMTNVRNGGLASSEIYGPASNFSYNAYLSDFRNVMYLNNTINVDLNNVQHGTVYVGHCENFRFHCSRFPGSEYLCKETKIYSSLNPATYFLPLYNYGWDIHCLATDSWACFNVEINFANSDYNCALSYTDPGWDYCGLAAPEPTTTTSPTSTTSTTPNPDTTLTNNNITQSNAVCRSVRMYGGAQPYVPMHYCRVNYKFTTGQVTSHQWLCSGDGDVLLVWIYANANCSGSPFQTYDMTAQYSNYPLGFDCTGNICPPELISTVTERQCTSCMNENCVETGDYEVTHFVTDHCIASSVSNDANSFRINCEDSVGMTAQQYTDDSCGSESVIFLNSSLPSQGCQNSAGPFVDINCAHGMTATTMTPVTATTTSTGSSAVCDVITADNVAYPMYYCNGDTTMPYQIMCNANNDVIIALYGSDDCTGTFYEFPADQYDVDVTGVDCSIPNICPPTLVSIVIERECVSCMNDVCNETGEYTTMHVATDQCITEQSISIDTNSFQSVCDDFDGLVTLGYSGHSCAFEANTFTNLVHSQGCQINEVPLIDTLPSGAFSGSSQHDPDTYCYYYNGRRSSPQAWCAAQNTAGQYLQVDLGQEYEIGSVSVWPRNGPGNGQTWPEQFVKTYTLKYSSDGSTFTAYPDTLNGPQQANTGVDADDEANSVLDPAISARYLRFYPVTYNVHMSMRVEAYEGGQINGSFIEILCGNGTTTTTTTPTTTITPTTTTDPTPGPSTTLAPSSVQTTDIPTFTTTEESNVATTEDSIDSIDNTYSPDGSEDSDFDSTFSITYLVKDLEYEYIELWVNNAVDITEEMSDIIEMSYSESTTLARSFFSLEIEELLDYKLQDINQNNYRKFSNAKNAISMYSQVACDETICLILSDIQYHSEFEFIAQTKLRTYFDSFVLANAAGNNDGNSTSSQLIFEIEDFSSIEAINIIPPVTVSEMMEDNSLVTVLIIIMSIMIVISCFAFFDKRKVDQSLWFALIIYGLQLVNFVSDINFWSELYSHHKFTTNSTIETCAICAIIFILIPYAINLYYGTKIEMLIPKDNTSAVSFFERKSHIFMALVIMCGGCYPSALLLSSSIFGLDMFNSGIINHELRKMGQIKVIASVCLANIPMICIQCIYAATINEITVTTAMAFIISVLSIICTPFTTNTKYTIHKYFVEIRIESNVDETFISNAMKTKKMSKIFCAALDSSEIQISRVPIINSSQSGVILYLSHFVDKCTSIVEIEKLYSKKQEFLQSECKKHFDLKGGCEVIFRGTNLNESDEETDTFPDVTKQVSHAYELKKKMDKRGVKTLNFNPTRDRTEPKHSKYDTNVELQPLTTYKTPTNGDDRATYDYGMDDGEDSGSDLDFAV